MKKQPATITPVIQNLPEFTTQMDNLVTDYAPHYRNGFLPQTDKAYTSLAIVRMPSGRWVCRQCDVVDGIIISTIDTRENARAVIFEYYQVAAADLMYKENYK